MKWQTAITLTLGFAAGILLGSSEVQAHDESECPKLECPEPPPCPPCPCLQVEGPLFPESDVDQDGILDVQDVQPRPQPDQKAIQKALELIEKAEEAAAEEQVEE